MLNTDISIPQSIHNFELPPSTPSHLTNKIVSILQRRRIDSNRSLRANFSAIMADLNDQGVLKAKFSDEKCLRIFKMGLEKYSELKGQSFSLTPSFIQAYLVRSQNNLPEDDLTQITKSYDRFTRAKESLEKTSQVLNETIKQNDFIPSLIIGAGDAATTLWLNKYKDGHGCLETNESPQVLMLADDTGSWKHDYTLAQSHNLLERVGAPSNPADFIKKASYKSNNYVNARHLYQSNLINLAKTKAPVAFGVCLQSIEKKENHLSDWKVDKAPYRVQLTLKDGTKKALYTDEIEVCTGLGEARNIFPQNFFKKKKLYKELSKFNETLGYTPIVDGNEFMLTARQEKKMAERKIIVYGGGGNATACFGKSINGKDERNLGQKSQNHTPNALWFSRNGFEEAGYGTLAKEAIKSGKTAERLFTGELRKIKYDAKKNQWLAGFEMTQGSYKKKPIAMDKKLVSQNEKEKLVWIKDLKTGRDNLEMRKLSFFEFDQFVSSVGQDNSKMREISKELKDLKLKKRNDGMALGIESSDGKITFYGAVASTIEPKLDYYGATRSWILDQNICKDAEWPGVMPPSRLQIREAAFKDNPPTALNTNMDDLTTIKAFLVEQGAEEAIAHEFTMALKAERLNSESGISKKNLKALIKKFNLTNFIEVRGHCHIAEK